MAQTTPFGVRLDVETKAALEDAAKADRRSMASLVNKVLTDWLRENGYLSQQEPSRPESRAA